MLFLSLSSLLSTVLVETLALRVFSRTPLADNVPINKTIRLSVPTFPQRGRQVVDANFQSYSIEFSYMLDYAGNDSTPNHFSWRMLRNLYSIRGEYPIIRAGGTTQNRAVYNASQTEAYIATFGSDPDQPSSLTIGPTWIQSFQQFPKGTKYIYGLNFYDGDYGLNQTLMEAANAWDAIADDIYAFSIGNEVNGSLCIMRRVELSLTIYTQDGELVAAPQIGAWKLT